MKRGIYKIWNEDILQGHDISRFTENNLYFAHKYYINGTVYVLLGSLGRHMCRF